MQGWRSSWEHLVEEWEGCFCTLCQVLASRPECSSL